MSDVAALTAYSPQRIAAASRATYAAFIGAGFAFASWASRIPQVRSRLELSPAHLGLVLLAIAAGSVVALPISGLILHRLNTRVTVTVMAFLLSAALCIVGVGYLGGVVPVLVGLFLLGFANGAWDVAMNVQGADVERHLGKAIMPRYHAGFSLGTVFGALIGAVMIALSVPVTAHLVGAAVVVAVVVPLMVRQFLPDPVHLDVDGESNSSAPSTLARWREPRTLLVGVFVLAFAFSEGTGNDWISVALIDGYHAEAVVGTLGFAVFLTAMTVARWSGPGLLDRYGRVVVVRWLALVAVVGLILFVFSPNVPLAFVGALLWGTGTSLGFPVGMSAAADDPAAAAGRVSVVASIGYCAFLGGPPLIGFLGSRVGVLHALTAVAVLLAIAMMLANALRPLSVTAPVPTTESQVEVDRSATGR
ncbi:fucose permease [Jatrophihabitans sp. GAS493]|uniref:MFS transporter n=1 Tax=Jatrophihabitans sp. GAS493 TaxID=1907575 RepID=UPI000BB86B90|nr:MFS transporter [Jatrophihabitans sp. GAS493]SOD71468.1 fucose permease [Jatrophihabitans sp. GAS493]